jgi:hypothetical protein
MRGHLDPQDAHGVARRRTDLGTLHAVQQRGPGAAGQLDPLADVDDRANAGELVALARHQHDPLLVADVDGEGDRHVREDD